MTLTLLVLLLTSLLKQGVMGGGLFGGIFGTLVVPPASGFPGGPLGSFFGGVWPNKKNAKQSIEWPELPHATFFKRVYECRGGSVSEDDREYFLVRQVPGDGGCLFHAMTVCLDYMYSAEHRDFDEKLRHVSTSLRRLAVDLLKRENDTLVMDNNEVINSSQLLAIVAEHYKMTEEAYCDKMLQPKEWGGGPEIVVISNHLKRPIHVYELSGTAEGSTSSCDGIFGNHKLKICAKFGSPFFDRHAPPLKILCADGRFPNIRPGKHKPIGDHFLALFPCDSGGKLCPHPGGGRTKSSWWDDETFRPEKREEKREAPMGARGG